MKTKEFTILTSPSILSADFGNLEKEVKGISASGCDLIHVDIMDGHFVPNITMGPDIVKKINTHSAKPLDIHLMVENNDFFVDLFSDLKPEYITFHIESEKHPHKLIQKIKSNGIKAGIALNPHTNPETIKYLLKEVDMVLLMSVNPGFGGQKFVESTIDKLKELYILKEFHNPSCLIEVDGGINAENATLLEEAGADILVAGSFVFKHPEGHRQAIKELKGKK